MLTQKQSGLLMKQRKHAAQMFALSFPQASRAQCCFHCLLLLLLLLSVVVLVLVLVLVLVASAVAWLTDIIATWTYPQRPNRDWL